MICQRRAEESICGLVAYKMALLPLLGPDCVWPLEKAIEVLEYAHSKKRHWLTALSGDDLHVRQHAPERVVLQAMAAAALDFAVPRSDRRQASLAAEIAEAMGDGGFRVQGKKPPSARTIQDWRSQFLPGIRKNRKAPFSVSSTSFEAFWARILEDIRQYAWSVAEVEAGQTIAAKSGG